MNLAEISAVLSARHHPEEDCEGVMALLEEHAIQIVKGIAGLERLERYLRQFRGCCHEGNVARDYGILEGIANGVVQRSADAG